MHSCIHERCFFAPVMVDSTHDKNQAKIAVMADRLYSDPLNGLDELSINPEPIPKAPVLNAGESSLAERVDKFYSGV